MTAGRLRLLRSRCRSGLSCASAQPPNRGLSFAFGSADLSWPLGGCLPRALATADGTRDIGRVSVDSARYMGKAESLRSNVRQRHDVRLFQSQDEPGPRFFDALVTEYACGADRLQLEIVVSIVSVEDVRVEALARRVDSLLAQVLSECKAEALSISPAARGVAPPPPCGESPK